MSTGTVLLDVDGTLVDSAWLHTLAWQRACRRHGLDVPAWRIGDRIGMGGDVLVADLLGDDVEERLGDALRDAWAQEVEPLLDELQVLPGAADLVRELARRGWTVVLASSGAKEHTDRALDLLDVRDEVDLVTSSEDAGTSKPAPDLFAVAWEKADAPGDAPVLVVGDAPFDADAARKAGMPSVGLRTGGFSDAQLRDAGAGQVYDDAAALLADLDAALATARPVDD